MRQLKPKPKTRRRVAIPDELRSAIAEAARMIEGQPGDPDSSLDFDDAIQIRGLCGGSDGSVRRPYKFSWSVNNAARCRWRFGLHPLEIEDIADGVVVDLMLYCCTNSECQCKFQDADDHCAHCDFEDNDPTALHLTGLADRFSSKREFVEEFLRMEPNAGWSRMLSVFQPIPGLGERVGWFSAHELEHLILKLRGERKD